MATDKPQRPQSPSSPKQKDRALNAAPGRLTGGKTTPPDLAGDSRGTRLGLILLPVLILAVYGQTLAFPFVLWDDDIYVIRNDRVANGLTPATALWAFTAFECSNWHPATWLSHLLDSSLYGGWAGGHHFTSVLLHGINTFLVWAVIWRLTGRQAESLCAAVVFAIHPQRVESVAWVSERKDVLCGTGVLLTVWAYLNYADPRSAENGSRTGWYAGVLTSCALACLAKPMAVTLPCVLLLLDAWPLARMPGLTRRPGTPDARSFLHLVVEKLPLIAMVVLTSRLTLLAQQGAVNEMRHVPLAERLANAIAAYVDYLQHAIWPTGLAAFYPHAGHRLPAVEIGLSAALFATITVATVAVFSRAGWFAVGWLWFLGMLVPVIGVVQVGAQGMADRYYYLPGVGLEMALILGLGSLARRCGVWLQAHRSHHAAAEARRIGLWVLAGIVALLTALAFLQVGTWSSTELLWRHATMVVPGNYVALSQLGAELDRQGRTAEAIAAQEAALALEPGFYDALTHLGMLLSNEGQSERALPLLRLAAESRPDDVDTFLRLAICLTRLHRAPEAEATFRKALAIDPDNTLAVVNYALFLADAGRAAEARRTLEARQSTDPGNAVVAEALERLAPQVTDPPANP